MTDIYINRECQYYDWGKTAPRDYGAFCSKKSCTIDNANCELCEENHKLEVKREILYILDYAIDFLESKSDDDKFMCPNGSLWTYGEVKSKLKEYIK